MDGNPALMAQNEAVVQKVMTQEGQPVNNYIYDQPVSESTGITIDTSKQEQQQRKLEQQQECQADWTEYNSCVSKNNSEYVEYQECLETKLERDGYWYCSKPYSDYCSKPFCIL